MFCFALMTFLDFGQLEVNLPSKGPHDQGHDQDVEDQEEGLFDAPRHTITSDGRTDFDVHVTGRPLDAPKTGAFVHQEIVQSGGKNVGQRNFSIQQGHHA